MRYFFILALGRSGTTFTSRLLEKDKQAVVYHEPWKDDIHYLRLAYYYNSDSQLLKKLLDIRFDTLIASCKAETQIYGEVGGSLRYHVDYLRRKFQPVILHLARDGRDYVRSAYTRHQYDSGAGRLPIFPLDNDPSEKRWCEYSRFQKLCWLWSHTNEFLLSKVGNLIRLEDILESYDYFWSKVLNPIGLNIPEKMWHAAKQKPLNTTKARLRIKTLKRMLRIDVRSVNVDPLPHWKDWDENLTRQFWEICGSTMKKLGYRG